MKQLDFINIKPSDRKFDQHVSNMLKIGIKISYVQTAEMQIEGSYYKKLPAPCVFTANKSFLFTLD